MEAFLEQLRLGKSINQATAAVGVSTHAYNKWRGRVPGFAAEVTRIRARLTSGSYPKHAFDADFRLRYFGLDTPTHMHAALDLINGLDGGQAGLIQLPPAHGKTSLCEDYICWSIAHNPDIRVIVVSRSETPRKCSRRSSTGSPTARATTSSCSTTGPSEERRATGARGRRRRSRWRAPPVRSATSRSRPSESEASSTGRART